MLRISGYWRQLYRAKWVIVAITAGTFLLSTSGMLDHFETAGLDAFNLLKQPVDPTDVVIVAITDDDYQAPPFNSISPLNVGGVQEALNAIALAKPRVIGVDLDTSDSRFKELHAPPGDIQLVWGRDARFIKESKKFVLEPVLGGSDTESFGVALLPLDGDGIVRRYRREFPGPGGVAPSFPWAVIEKACGEHPEKYCGKVDKSEQEHETLLLNFAGQRFAFEPLSVHNVLIAAKGPEWARSSPLLGKIVILGGNYHAARDSRVTPVGAMEGVQLMAQAIETELTGGGIRNINEAQAVILDLLSGALLVYFSYRFPNQLGKALLLSLIALVILPPLFSYLAFSTLGRWFNFVPMLVGVLLHELYEHGKEYGELRAAHGAGSHQAEH